MIGTVIELTVNRRHGTATVTDLEHVRVDSVEVRPDGTHITYTPVRLDARRRAWVWDPRCRWGCTTLPAVEPRPFGVQSWRPAAIVAPLRVYP